VSDWTGGLPILDTDVRAYLNAEGTTGTYTSATINSNIRAAASLLQRQTMRQIAEQNAVTKYFTTEGRAYITIPDIRTVTSVALQSSALVANQSYYLIPDSQQSGVYTGIQFRAFGSDSYLSNPEWFDRNLDQQWYRYGNVSSVPNDLAITGNWGWSPYPNEFLHACKVLAAFYTKRPASVLADVAVTPDGTALSYSQLPVEVRGFIESWQAGSQLVVV
jgi:hypothetical protein